MRELWAWGVQLDGSRAWPTRLVDSQPQSGSQCCERARRRRLSVEIDDRLGALRTAAFELACERDLEGIVAKWARRTYQCDGRGTSWLKIKNPEYSQGGGAARTVCSEACGLAAGKEESASP